MTEYGDPSPDRFHDAELPDTSTSVLSYFPNIAAASAACRDQFTQCLTTQSLKEAWAEDRLADFNIWDASMAASSASRSSLENRLESKPLIRNVVLNILNVLYETISHCKDLGN